LHDVIVQSPARASGAKLFVPCRRAPPAGSMLPLRLMLPSGDPETANAVVSSVVEGDGFECELKDLRKTTADRLRAALEPAVSEPPPPAPAPQRSAPPEPQIVSLPPPVALPPPVSLAPPTESEPAPAPARGAVHFKLRFADRKTFIENHGASLASGRVFVGTARELPVGAFAHLTIILPDDGPPVSTVVQVVRVVRAGEGDAPHNGLFLQMVGNDRGLVERVQALMGSA
jgi:hypothetical protein